MAAAELPLTTAASIAPPTAALNVAAALTPADVFARALTRAVKDASALIPAVVLMTAAALTAQDSPALTPALIAVSRQNLPQ